MLLVDNMVIRSLDWTGLDWTDSSEQLLDEFRAVLAAEPEKASQ
ncbi:hypothetical protein [Catenulispora pinisilvae]|nr:hypothetical protein [Catenulispora pinisilvae]